VLIPLNTMRRRVEGRGGTYVDAITITASDDKALKVVQEKVTTGQSLAEPLEKCGFFPPLLVQIVNIGERSGRLEPMLLHAATAFDRQVNTSLKLFTKLLPPVLMVLMAMIAGFVLAGILLPLMEMQKALGG
jgi:type II secretory pathway component PulF